LFDCGDDGDFGNVGGVGGCIIGLGINGGVFGMSPSSSRGSVGW
jgi:hypothetical protein